MNLSHPIPDMATPALQRLEKCLAADCNCGGDRGQLCRREIEPESRPSYWTVWLQCLTCGRGCDGPLTLGAHFKWKSYPEWDPLLRERWEADRLARPTAAGDEVDPEWKELLMLVLLRSRGVCEACLKQPPVAVHRKTYAFGLLPPASLLEAVCQTCHDRFHTPGDAWCPQTAP